jgi:hypothetical protein
LLGRDVKPPRSADTRVNRRAPAGSAVEDTR